MHDSRAPRPAGPVRQLLARVARPTTLVAVAGALVSLIVSYLVSQFAGK